MEFDKMMLTLRKLALQAGDRIMEIYADPNFEVRSKSDESPVTEADEAADCLAPRLRERRRDDPDRRLALRVLSSCCSRESFCCACAASVR